MKLLVVGFDAVGWESVLPKPRPRLQVLMKDHPYGELNSTRPPHTLPAMFAVYEGIDRSSDFYIINKRKRGTRRLSFSWNVSWNDAKYPLIFDMLAKADVTMGLVGLPFTAPVRPYREFVLGSWMRDRKTEKKGPRNVFHPESLRETINHRGCILRELGGDRYTAFIHKPMEALEKSEEFARLRLNNFLKLNEKFDVDLGFLYFDFPDRVAHLIPEGSPVLDATMDLCDQLLGEALDVVQPEQVLVFSDHGWGFHRTKATHHNPLGFYIYTGKKGGRTDANITSIAPTILREFNVEPPHYFKKEIV